jgi:CheY-like chemotaxis protein
MPKKILIVDDHPETTRLLEVILRSNDRKLYLAESGEQALEIARRAHPDLILLDIMMPGGIDGYEVARRLKKDPETSSGKIIVMTAKVRNVDRMNAFASGADDYISKPFDIFDIRKRVEKFLKAS